MKTLPLVLCTAALAAGATGALATPDTEAGQRVEISAGHDPLAAAQAVLAARGFDSSYATSTGQRMRVTAVGGAVNVRYGRRMARTLQHDGQGRFVSGDGTLALRFELDDAGAAEHVRLTLPASWL